MHVLRKMSALRGRGVRIGKRARDARLCEREACPKESNDAGAEFTATVNKSHGKSVGSKMRLS